MREKEEVRLGSAARGGSPADGRISESADGRILWACPSRRTAGSIWPVRVGGRQDPSGLSESRSECWAIPQRRRSAAQSMVCSISTAIEGCFYGGDGPPRGRAAPSARALASGRATLTRVASADSDRVR